MIVINRPLTVNDLRLTVRSAGRLQVADSVSYVITGGDFSAAGEATVHSTGVYFPEETITGNTLGTYAIVWDFVVGGVSFQSIGSFVVYDAANSISGEVEIFTDAEADYINKLRYALRDFNPNKFYTMAPMLDPENRSQLLDDTQDYIWETFELYLALDKALADINIEEPSTSYTFSNLPPVYKGILLEGARAEAMLVKAINWAAQSYIFSMEKGSLEVDRADTYKGLASDLQAAFMERLQRIKPGREKHSRFAYSDYYKKSGNWGGRW